jgi:pro-sigmaK processing inhibitor BofA
VKKISKMVCKLIISPFLIYIFDLLLIKFGLMIPINLYTILVVGLLGIPGLFIILILI